MGGASVNFLRKPHAHLGELDGNLLPIFSINRPRGGCSKGSLTPMLCISAILGEKTCFREENLSRGASVTLSRRFCEQFHEDFPLFFAVLRLFFVRSSFFNRLVFESKTFNSFLVLFAFIFISFTFDFLLFRF